LTDADGRSAGMLGLSLDITERQQAEAARMKLQAKLLEVQRLESLGLMAGGIAHDFNNLLTVIMGNASTALLSLPKGSAARADVEAVLAASQRAADLTRQMLAYSGRGQFDVRPLDVSAQVREIAALVYPSIPVKVELRLELGPAPAVLADAAHIQQVIMNLVLNAAEAIGEAPGHVVITTSERHIDGAEAMALSADAPLTPGRHVLLEVRDSGSGMDAATLKRIFDPFFTTKFTGRGLGLAAVLGIVRAHSGAILVDSTLGKGSTFQVFLPSCEDNVELPRPPAMSYAGAAVVLVIDDDANVRAALLKMLASCGLQVIEAADGPSGARTASARASEITLVLLDMTMPGMDGEETLRAIREHSSVPVVLISGYGEAEATRRFAGLGLAGFLQKPFSSEQLSEKLHQVLQAGR
jgi:two-component system cell cycle sensor histidine kinase/response regulator CckA